jgi:putative endonuclease
MLSSIAHVDSPTPPDIGSPAKRPEDPRRALGRLGENLAVAHLERLGFTILDRNCRTRHGEIDVIAFNGTVIAFVEVKTRRVRRWPHDAPPSPLEGLRHRQRARQRGLASAWLKDQAPGVYARDLRFDAVGILVDPDDRLMRLDHVEGAW